MSNILKKPYEISLWDEQLYWHRRKLVEVSVSKQNYTPGKYYSQSSIGQGAKPYVLDNGPYVEGKKYYTLAPKTSGNYVEGPSASDTNVDSTFGVSTLFQFYKEKKLCVIGSNTMTAPIRAAQPKLSSKITGENTLTFTVYSHYWDEATNELMWNPFMQYLTNERKVKLHYDGKWYDFIIKNISEDSTTKAFVYTCKDLFLNELSKTGFELEFDAELGNNMGTLTELATKVLDGSDWQLKADNVVIKQYLEEPLYEFTFQESTYLTNGAPTTRKMVYEDSTLEPEVDFPYGEKFYAFYGSVNNKSSTLQFLYDPKGAYTKDDKNVILGDSSDNPNGVYNYYIEGITWLEEGKDSEKRLTPQFTRNGVTYSLTKNHAVFSPENRGEKLIKNPVTHFEPKLDKVLTHYTYNNGQNRAYGFTSTEYISPAIVENYVANPNTFTSTVGWGVGKNHKDEGFPDLIADTYPSLASQIIDKTFIEDPVIYLKFSPQATGQTLVNEGINSYKLDIKELVKGEKFIFNFEIYKEQDKKLVSATNGTDYIINIREYLFKDGIYESVKDDALFSFTKIEEGRNEYEATCLYSLSKEALSSTKIGIIIRNNTSKPLYIKNVEFFRKKIDPETGEFLRPHSELIEGSDFELKSDIKTIYHYFQAGQEYSSIDDLTFLYRGEEPNTDYKPDYGEKSPDRKPYEKVRSITAKESNRFNLLQSLCELFQCWAKFDIEHETNGEIKLDTNYRYAKWISFHEYIGEDNPASFRYGINLKGIKRQLDSNGAISKIIVKQNSNEFAPNGFCTIARAEENQTGENTIYNFDYYVGQGLLNFSTLNNDLYLQPTVGSGYIGYCKSLKPINEEIQKIIEIRAELEGDIAKYSSEYKTFQLSHDAAEEDLRNQKIEFQKLVGASYEDVKKNPSDNAKKWLQRDEVIKILAAIARDEVVIDKHGSLARVYKNKKELAEKSKTSWDRQLEKKREQKLAINRQFYKKYSRFIQEGSWISEDYMDDNLYYMDALSTLYTSSRPKVTYTIDVIELSALPDYSAYRFKVGDKTYVEDKEFFGWAYDGSGRLYREEVIVTETIFELDSPEKNIIKVQNYKTQFEDLFQRVVATTQQVQFSTGEYKRSAAIVEPGGTINVTALQNSFTNNAITIQNARDQSVVIGEDGITTTNLGRPSEMLRIISGGIFLSGDGGTTWTTGITANGINANSITTGTLNTEKINITMGSDIAFRWDKLGISAYKRGTDGISPGTFTRFDQYGLYGINNNDNFNLEGKERDEALQYLQANATFGLTWDAFWLKSTGTNGYVSISSDNDFQVIRYDENSTEIPIIQIGRLNTVDSNYYGLRINNLQGQTMLETNQDGELWLKKALYVQTYGKTEGKDNTVSIGALGEDSSYSKANKVIDANNKFKVFEDGHIEGTDAHFSGGSKFEGTIEATGGTIGGLDIEEWKEMGFSVRIKSTAGLVLKGRTPSTTLIAEFYKGNTKVSLDENSHFVDTDGTEYEVSYQWLHNNSIMAYANEIEVTMTDNASDTYTCEVILERLNSTEEM